MLQRIKAFARDSKAVSALEYAILVGVIAVALVTLMDQFTSDMEESINNVGTNVKTLTGTVGTPSSPGP